MSFQRADFNWLLYGVMFLICSIPVFGQADGEVSPGISELWARQMTSFNLGFESPECQESHLDLVEYLLDNGVVRAQEISAAYVGLGLQAIENGHRKDAQWAFESALVVDSQNVPAVKAAFNNACHLSLDRIISTLSRKFKISSNEFFR